MNNIKTAMYQTNLKEITRWVYRNKATTLLSISGMAIGITVALLVGLWSLNEFSFDRFHQDSDRIYRVCRKGFINNESVMVGFGFAPVGTTAKEQFPEIEDVFRISTMSLVPREIVKVKEKTSYEDKIYSVDKNLFTFFSFKLESGDPRNCLSSPDQIVIDRYFANKYFNSENPIGQIIGLYGKQFTVSAVMENMPINSHLNFHAVVPIEDKKTININDWTGNDHYITYLKLKPNSDSKRLSEQISEMYLQHNKNTETIKFSHFLQPLQAIHFSSNFRFDFIPKGDRSIVLIFISLAALILMIATFNFINLFISTSFLRSKSIGIKMINGNSRAGLLYSSYFETTLYVLIATILALIASSLTLSSFNQLFGSTLEIDFSDYKIYLFTGILLVITILISGTIPVLYILRFNPETIIRNRFKGSGVSVLQRTLVICQFTASIILITSAGVIKKQISYIQNKDLGFAKEHVLYFAAQKLGNNYSAFRDELLKNPNILDVTAKSCLPYEWLNGNLISSADDPDKEFLMEVCEVKYNYTDLMNFTLLSGRNPFSLEKNQTKQCLINEQAAHVLGLIDAVGKQIKRYGREVYTIAGVLKNANTKSLHFQVDPQVYLPLHEVQETHTILVKTTDQVKSSLQSMAAVWKQNNSDIPFEYYFLDEAYGRLYKTEGTASTIITIGMFIALFLAFMGLYAISHYATERRIKEIGVRKVNGARISEVLVTLNKDFVTLIIIAIAIATPLAWYILHKWLENFAYKTSLSWWIFALSGLLALGIALLTVSWQSWKAATRNPVKALRYE